MDTRRGDQTCRRYVADVETRIETRVRNVNLAHRLEHGFEPALSPVREFGGCRG